MPGTVRKRLLLIEVHQQRGALKRLKPDVDQRSLVLEGRHVVAPTFAPISHRRNVDAVEVRIAVVARPGLTHNLSPVLQIERIAEIWLPDVTVFIRRLVGPARSRSLEPFRKRVPLVIGHQSNGECLSVAADLLESAIEDLPPDVPVPGLDRTPEPATVSD